MRVLAADAGDIERVEPGLNGGGIGIAGACGFGVAAGDHPAPADVAIDRRFVDRRQTIDPSDPSENAEVSVDCAAVACPGARAIRITARVFNVLEGSRAAAYLDKWTTAAPVDEIVDERPGDGGRVADCDAVRGIF